MSGGIRTRIAAAVTLLAASFAAACSPAAPAPAATTEAPKPAANQAASSNPYTALCPPAQAPKSMVLAVWGGPHEAILKSGLAGFTELTGTQVELTLDSSRDRLTRLNAEKNTPSLDVAIVTVDAVPRLMESGVIMPSQSDIPNLNDLVPAAKIDGGYGVSLLQLGIAYNPKLVTTPPTSWSDLLKPEWANHIAWSAMPNGSSLATLAMIARANGGSEANYQPGVEAIAKIAPGIKTFYQQEPQVEPQLQSGDIWLMPALAGLMQGFKDKGGPIEIVIPKEGGPILMNTATIPAGVKSPGCSKALVGWLLSSNVQVPYAEQLAYGPSNRTVKLEPAVAEKVFPRDEKSAVSIDWKAISDKQTEILDTWNRQVVGK